MDKLKDNKEKSYEGITKLMLILRAVVAGYVLYIAYTLLDSYLKGEGLPLYLLIICLVAFGGIAGVIFVLAVKALIKGEYAGGKMDKSDTRDKSESDGEEKSSEAEQQTMADRLSKYNK